LAREKAPQSDNLKSRITQRPNLEYKGILYSEGVTDKSFKVKPRHLTNQTSAFTQFKKTLFRLEIAQESASITSSSKTFSTNYRSLRENDSATMKR